MNFCRVRLILNSASSVILELEITPTRHHKGFMMNKIEVKNITKKYNEKLVLNDISFSLKENTTVALLGPSGCGKTTLFNIIAGLEEPDFGQIFLDGTEITNTPGKVSYMPQSDLLFPHKTILENVTLPLILNGTIKKDAENTAKKFFDTFLLSETENKFPHELSGGMRQRAAFLRTFLCEKKVLLLDEPFSALDNITKNAMHSWYINISKCFKKTTLLITHDIDEAILLADTILELSPNSHKIINQINISDNKNLDF